MDLDRIRELHAEHFVKGSGPIMPGEAACILEVIEKHRPNSFIELGTSSGLSTGLIANMLHDNGGEILVSVDVSARYYRDDSRPTGFLVSRMYQGGQVRVDLRSPATSLDVAEWQESYDMGFVDGNHGHPWPLLDLLALWPRISGSRTLVQHDLTLYSRQPKPVGIGPKYLFDQFPDSHRVRYPANRGNMFSVSLDLPTAWVETMAVEAFALPWTALRKVGGERLAQIQTMLSMHYRPAVRDAFERNRERFALSKRESAVAGPRRGR